jgi:hypothetical protein
MRAREWETERERLLRGEEAVATWIRGELEAYNERR